MIMMILYRPYTEKLLSNLYQLSYFPRTLNVQYIDSIGQNNWLSKFSENILPEVSEILQPLMIIEGMLIFFFCFR